jgi:hypothetical protein
MKFFEVNNPYYALIKAKALESAIHEYVVVVSDDDGTLIDEIKEVPSDYAIAKYSRTLSEDGNEVPLSEILSDIRSDETLVLIIDGNLR